MMSRYLTTHLPPCPMEDTTLLIKHWIHKLVREMLVT